MPDPFFQDVSVDDDQFIHRVNVLRSSATAQDEAGGLTIGQTSNHPVIVLRDFPCTVADLNAEERELFSRRDVVATHSVYFRNPRLFMDDLLQWGSRLLLVKSFSDQLGQGILLVAICFEQK